LIGSAKDRKAVALENCAKYCNLSIDLTAVSYTAVFGDDDSREAESLIPDANGKMVHNGFPMNDAVWRTNHAYDPTFLKTAMNKNSPSSDSQVRYDLVHESLVQFQSAGHKMGVADVAMITALIGDKGGSTPDAFHKCPVEISMSSLTWQGPHRQHDHFGCFRSFEVRHGHCF
jgi:hypothetical protein